MGGDFIETFIRDSKEESLLSSNQVSYAPKVESFIRRPFNETAGISDILEMIYFFKKNI